jgi:hypothetical protein
MKILAVIGFDVVAFVETLVLRRTARCDLRHWRGDSP